VNVNHVKNPQKHKLIEPNPVADTSSPGVGTDGVYRDPWGNPYVITMDLNYDGAARDGFYRSPNVSQDQFNANLGIYGLIKKTISGTTVFESDSPIMVWSAGPDGKVDANPSNAPDRKANKGLNKDNIVSWKE
jgi:hypothetical protein